MEMKGFYNANGIETTHVETSQHHDVSQQLTGIPTVKQCVPITLTTSYMC